MAESTSAFICPSTPTLTPTTKHARLEYLLAAKTMTFFIESWCCWHEQAQFRYRSISPSFTTCAKGGNRTVKGGKGQKITARARWIKSYDDKGH